MLASLITGVNLGIGILFTIFYSYQMFYLVVGLIDKQRVQKVHEPKKLHKIAFLICARNEKMVIGELCKSIQKQRYPKELFHVFVVADNCTDETADICRSFGCTVYERFNKQKVGKGFALAYGFEHIFADKQNDYEAFIVLDADNLLEDNYLYEMNRTFDQGYIACTSYRNSKNYAQNWITSGYGLWFLREAEYLNRPRAILGTSCAISGTGFLLSAKAVKDRGGWIYSTLTEDIEFTAATVIRSEKIGYAKNAVLYDEQPVTFAQSWRQRMRWAKGFYQVLGKYGGQLFKSVVSLQKGFFGCYDMLMAIMPALFVTLLSIIFNTAMVIYTRFFAPDAIQAQLEHISLHAITLSLIFLYATLFLVGAVTTITEWDNILASRYMKIRTIFTFPFFMMTYIPIAVVALFKKVEWKPIEHTVVRSIEDMKK